MRCPYCGMDAPDTNYKCPQCKNVLKQEFNPAESHKTSHETSPIVKKKKQSVGPNIIIIVITLIGLIILAVFGLRHMRRSAYEKLDELRDADVEKTMQKKGNHNASALDNYRTGTEIDIKKFVIDGQMTIFDFYSDYCGPCRKISPLLEQLDRKRDDLVVIKININRKHITRIDWTSPVVKQYKIDVVPYFIIYNADGQQTHKGPSASNKVYQLLQGAGLI